MAHPARRLSGGVVVAGSPELPAALISLMRRTGQAGGPVPPPRLEGAHFPVPDAIAAGLALHPRFRPFVHVAREEVAALQRHWSPVGGGSGVMVPRAQCPDFPTARRRGNRAASVAALATRDRPCERSRCSALKSSRTELESVRLSGPENRMGAGMPQAPATSTMLKVEAAAANPVSPSPTAARRRGRVNRNTLPRLRGRVGRGLGGTACRPAQKLPAAPAIGGSSTYTISGPTDATRYSRTRHKTGHQEKSLKKCPTPSR